MIEYRHNVLFVVNTAEQKNCSSEMCMFSLFLIPNFEILMFRIQNLTLKVPCATASATKHAYHFFFTLFCFPRLLFLNFFFYSLSKKFKHFSSSCFTFFFSWANTYSWCLAVKSYFRCARISLSLQQERTSYAIVIITSINTRLFARRKRLWLEGVLFKIFI